MKSFQESRDEYATAKARFMKALEDDGLFQRFLSGLDCAERQLEALSKFISKVRRKDRGAGRDDSPQSL